MKLQYSLTFPIAILAVLGFLNSNASACMVDMALPILIGQSDLIVIGSVTKDGKKGDDQVKIATMKQPMKAYFHETSFKIEKVLRNPGGKETVGSTISIISLARKPQNSGGPLLFVSDGPSYPNLSKGQKYLLLLQTEQTGRGYYLPAYPKNFVPFSSSPTGRVEEYEKLCNLDNWPWGEVSNGIQLAVIPAKTDITLMKSRKGNNGPFFWNAYTQIVYALRNTSSEPVAINHYPVDRFMDLKLKQGEQDELLDMWNFLATAKYAGFTEKNATVVQPGDIVFIAPYGVDQYGQAYSREAAPGKLEMQIEYSSKRKGSVNGVSLWQGRAVSGVATVNLAIPPEGK